MAVNNRKRQLHILLTLAVMVFIFIESAMPGDLSTEQSSIFVRILVALTGADTDAATFVVRKAAHFTIYAVLGACLMLNVNDWHKKRLADIHASDTDDAVNRDPIKTRQLWALAWMLGTAYAMTDELHQRFVPARSGEMRDVCIDAAGAALGAFIAIMLIRHKSSDSDPDLL